MDNKNVNSSTGLQSNIAGALTYVFGFVTGIIFMVVERKDEFVRFHAIQSTIISVILLALSTLLSNVPIFGGLIALLIGPASFILWVFLIYKAYKNEWFELPIIGKIAKDQADKTTIL